jgi:hypothetical protein
LKNAIASALQSVTPRSPSHKASTDLLVFLVVLSPCATFGISDKHPSGNDRKVSEAPPHAVLSARDGTFKLEAMVAMHKIASRIAPTPKRSKIDTGRGSFGTNWRRAR